MIVKVDQLKGKTETPETIEVDLSALIDVKGMKAMGNRLSQHTVKSVVLIAEINPQVQEAQAEAAPEVDEEPGEQPADSSPQPPARKIDLEITNPDDIDLEDNGQLDLF